MRAFLVALVFLCAVVTPASAQADDAAAAKAKYESGVRHFDLSEYEPALIDFKEAYRNKPDPVFLYNIAQCHRKLRHTEEAITFYQAYLRRAPEARNHEEVERRIAELQAIREAENAVDATAGKAQPPVQAAVAPMPATGETAASRSSVAAAPAAAPPPEPTPSFPTVPATQPTAMTTPGPAALDLSTRTQAAPAGPVYTRWWFWTAVGAVAAGTATVAIILARRDPTSIPSSGLGSQRALP
jgi:hypothetical protein